MPHGYFTAVDPRRQDAIVALDNRLFHGILLLSMNQMSALLGLLDS